MVGPSKILTVSYGTFSCTLEGFDEPFNTMKAIAEYFRDLAADDRYFGAEPPTPDAEMLHRIAEREIQRRVEAKINEHGVILRQTDAAPQPAPVVMAPAVMAPAVVETVEPEAAPMIAAAVAAAPAVVEVAEQVVAEAPEPEQAVAAEMSAVEAPAPVEEEVVVAVAEVAAEPEAEEQVPAMAEVMEEIVAEAAEPAEEEAADISLDAIMAAAQTDLPAPAVMEEVAPAPDSLAAKLQRIRAVVETVRAGQPVVFEEDEPTDLQPASAEGFDSDFGFELDMSEDAPELIAAEAARAEARADVEAYDSDDFAEDEGTAPVTLEADEEEEAASFLDEEFEAEEPVAEAVETTALAVQADEDDYEDEAPGTMTPDEDSALLARLSDLAQSTAVEAHNAPAPVEQHRPADRIATSKIEEMFDDEDEMDDAATAAADDMPEDHPSFYERARARVIRIGKAALGGAKAEDHDAHFDDEDDYAETADYESEEPSQTEHAAFAETQDDSGDDVERLMEEAKVKLEGAENRRRFSAIAHLKAAVAATLADRKMQPGSAQESAAGNDATDMSLYRDDLTKAVRPRRPAAEAGSTTRRPSLDARPAPLVLVSEQRVDRRSDDHDGAAIRPRRVSATGRSMPEDDDRMDNDDQNDLTPETASNFAEFAESLGAHNLTDLLEAAAVYTSSVEGQEHFTRPQLLRKVEFVSSRSEYNREDGLRSFGMLLRQGKIQKVAPGQFAIADASKYATEARRAAL